VKTVKRKAKSVALVWKEFGPAAGYHSYTAPAAKGSYYIIPTFERNVFNGYVVSQLDDLDARYLCGKPGHGGTRTWTRPRPSRKRIATPDGIVEWSPPAASRRLGLSRTWTPALSWRTGTGQKLP
jgi:hypothetical protein